MAAGWSVSSKGPKIKILFQKITIALLVNFNNMITNHHIKIHFPMHKSKWDNCPMGALPKEHCSKETSFHARRHKSMETFVKGIRLQKL